MATKRSKAGRHCEKAKSLCCVCCKATEDRKVKALFCEGQYQKWLHCYCADFTLGLYEELTLSELCFTCCQIQLITELRGKVDMLRFGLSQLKAQLQLTRPQILSNKLSTKSGEENGSWQLVKKKLHCERYCSQHGATQTTEARARSTASLVSSNEPEVRMKWLVLGGCGNAKSNTVKSVSLCSARIPLLK